MFTNTRLVRPTATGNVNPFRVRETEARRLARRVSRQILGHMPLDLSDELRPTATSRGGNARAA